MINRSHTLPVTKQSKALGLGRGSVYYRPQPVSGYDQGLMTRMDRLHMAWPFAGARMLRDLLRQECLTVGRTHVATLMKRMGLEALYQKSKTTQRHPAPSGLSLLITPSRHHKGQSRVGDGCGVRPHGQGLCVSGGRGGLGDATHVGLARVLHDGGPILPRCGGGGH